MTKLHICLDSRSGKTIKDMSLGSAIIAAGEPNNPSIQNHIDVKILGEIDSDLEEEI